MKRRYYFFPLSILLSVLFYWSCQTDLVAPQTEHVESAVTQNLATNTNSSSSSSRASTTSLEHEENDNPIIGKIVARRDRPETWDDLGDNAHFEYYARTFAENEDVQTIIHFEECQAFSAVSNLVDDNIVFVYAVPNNGIERVEMHAITQPNGEPTPSCMGRKFAELVSRHCPCPYYLCFC